MAFLCEFDGIRANQNDTEKQRDTEGERHKEEGNEVEGGKGVRWREEKRDEKSI